MLSLKVAMKMADDTEVLEITTDEDEEMDCHVIENDLQNNKELAEKKKLEGNILYQQKNYREALQLYSQAIELCPTCAAYYGNRSACLMMLARYKEALEDSRQAIMLDANFVKGYIRASKCYVTLGDPAAAIHSIDKAREIDQLASVQAELQAAQAVQFFESEAQIGYSKGDFRKVIYYMDRALEHAIACRRYKVLKAECLVLLGRYQESQEIANEVLQMESINADAMYVKGLCLYYQDNIEKAFTYFQQVLRLSPDHCKAKEAYRKARSLKNKKEEGNTAFRIGDFSKAFTLYSEALAIDPFNRLTNAKLYFNRATVCSKINKLDQAIEDCTRALEHDENYVKAYMRRAKCYMDKEQYEEAVKDYEKIYSMEKNRENKRLLQEAKLELKKSKRKDYYKILGISRTATDDDIKKAYRKRALVHHPDRHTGETSDKQKEEERKFKEVGEAYGILSDPKKRARYDNGQDLDDGLCTDVDPNNIFQAFFGSSGFTFGQDMNGFPGDFTFHYG